MFITGCDGIFESSEAQQEYDDYKILCLKGIDKLQEYFVTAIASKLKTNDKHYLMMHSFLKQTESQIRLFNDVMLPMLFELKEYSLKNSIKFSKLQEPLFYALSILGGKQELQSQYEHFSSYTFDEIRQGLKNIYQIKDEKLLTGFQSCRVKYQMLLDQALDLRSIHMQNCNSLTRHEQEIFSKRWNRICDLINDKLYPLSLKIKDMEHLAQICGQQNFSAFFKPEDAIDSLKKRKELFEEEFSKLFTDFELELESNIRLA